MRQIVVVTVVAALALGAPSLATATQEGASSNTAHRARALTAERAGKLRTAYVELGKVGTLTKAQTRHRSHLGAAILAVTAADAFEKAGDEADAKSTLDAARRKLDADADRFVIVALADRSAKASAAVAADAAAAREPADKQAAAAITKGDALGKDERWTDAAAVYKSVATKPAGEISAAVRQTATVKQLAAEQAAIEAEPGPTSDFFTSVWHTIRDALKWLLLALIVVAIGLAMLLVRRSRRSRPVPGRTSLLLVDATAEVKDQDAGDHALRNEFADAVQEVRYRSLAAEGADIDERRDLDGTAAPSMLRPTAGGGLDAVVKDVQLNVGAVKVSPLQLIAFWQWLRDRPGEHVVTGTLRASGKGAEICIDAGDRHWSAARETEGERSALIQEVAQKYVVESNFSYITRSWRSYAAYADGLAALTLAGKTPSGKREKVLEEARAALERSVCQDSANLLARLRLASVLRSMGRNLEAAAHFSRLMEDLRNPGRVPQAAEEFVARHPELFWVAAVNCAVSMGKSPDARRYAVIADLAILVAKLGPAGAEPPVLDAGELPALQAKLATTAWPTALPAEADCRRLYVVALSAWAASLAITVDKSDKRASPAELERLRARRVRVIKRLKAVKHQLADGGLSDVGSAVGQAEAVVENAIARVTLRQGMAQDAREAAERALALNPDLGDAHVTLAKLAMVDEDGDWSSEAERHLRTALTVSPKDRRAQYQLGKLYRKIGDTKAAKKAFTVLRTDWRALEELGGMAFDSEDYAEAIMYLVRSQGRKPSGDERARRLVDAVIALREVPHARLLKLDGKAAMRAADRWVKALISDPDKRDTAVGRRTLLADAIDMLTQARADPPSDGAPEPHTATVR